MCDLEREWMFNYARKSPDTKSRHQSPSSTLHHKYREQHDPMTVTYQIGCYTWIRWGIPGMADTALVMSHRTQHGRGSSTTADT